MTDTEAPRSGAVAAASDLPDKYAASENISNSPTTEVVPERRPLRKRLLAVIWDSLDKAPEERAFIAKVDWWILSYCCIAYFVKYLDQTNVTNAYVSGMHEDLDMTGNDLNYLTTYFNIGYIVGNIPSQIILTKVRPSVWLPTLELLWSALVMGMAGAKSVKTLYVLRFFIGLLEASAYPGIMTLLGNWYTPMELGKRSCIFQASSSAAQLFSGCVSQCEGTSKSGCASSNSRQISASRSLRGYGWTQRLEGVEMALHLRRNHRHSHRAVRLLGDSRCAILLARSLAQAPG
jgi:hypothetical protein